MYTGLDQRWKFDYSTPSTANYGKNTSKSALISSFYNVKSTLARLSGELNPSKESN